MELKANIDYFCMKFEIKSGDTTEGRDDITEDQKQYLLETFPEWFSKVGSAPNKEFNIESKEDRLEIQTKAEPKVEPKHEPKLKGNKK